MKSENRLFDIVSLSDCNNCVGTYTNPVLSRYMIPRLSDHQRLEGIFEDIVGAVKDIIGIFDGDGNGLPGDYNNRVNQAHAWAVQYNVVECVDHNKVAQLITNPGVWQGRTQAYMLDLQKQKQETGSCQSVFGTPGGWGGGGATLFAPGSMMPLLLVGGGLLLIMNTKKRR